MGLNFYDQHDFQKNQGGDNQDNLYSVRIKAITSIIHLLQESHFKDQKQKVCGTPNLAPKLMSGNRTCPEHCTSELSLHFNKNNVEINPKTGEFSMKNPSDALKVKLNNKL